MRDRLRCFFLGLVGVRRLKHTGTTLSPKRSHISRHGLVTRVVTKTHDEAGWRQFGRGHGGGARLLRGAAAARAPPPGQSLHPHQRLLEEENPSVQKDSSLRHQRCSLFFQPSTRFLAYTHAHKRNLTSYPLSSDRSLPSSVGRVGEYIPAAGTDSFF